MNLRSISRATEASDHPWTSAPGGQDLLTAGDRARIGDPHPWRGIRYGPRTCTLPIPAARRTYSPIGECHRMTRGLTGDVDQSKR